MQHRLFVRGGTRCVQKGWGAERIGFGLVPGSGRKNLRPKQNDGKKAELWSWLQDGAIFYVCGDAHRMAKDVDQALKRIVAEEGSMSEEDALAWVKGMQRERRYLKDVY